MCLNIEVAWFSEFLENPMLFLIEIIEKKNSSADWCARRLFLSAFSKWYPTNGNSNLEQITDRAMLSTGESTETFHNKHEPPYLTIVYNEPYTTINIQRSYYDSFDIFYRFCV